VSYIGHCTNANIQLRAPVETVDNLYINKRLLKWDGVLDIGNTTYYTLVIQTATVYNIQITFKTQTE